jgi:hypothetical protein
VASIRFLMFICGCPVSGGTKEKAPSDDPAGLGKRCVVTRVSVAQVDRPAEAGMMVPVDVHETRHLRLS